jgi:DNA (cytosine-5)-methyltransferase 1
LQRESVGASKSTSQLANNEQCGSDGRRNGTCGRIGESKEVEADAIAGGSESYVLWQAQPPLGGDAYGSAGGLDYAGLCVSCDNRTDELRLLGNGVVPQTAEKAFLTLIKQEIQH